MTDTLSEREKELVEEARGLRQQVIDCEREGYTKNVASNVIAVIDALKAYDLKPEPVPVIPSWEELTVEQKGEVNRAAENYVRTGYGVYNIIRKATARMPD